MPKFLSSRKRSYKMYRGSKWFGNWTKSEMDEMIQTEIDMKKSMLNPDSHMTEEEHLKLLSCGDDSNIEELEKKLVELMRINKGKKFCYFDN